MGKDTKTDLRIIGWDVTYGLIWLTIRSSGDLKWRRWLTYSSTKSKQLCWLTERLLGCQGLCSMQLLHGKMSTPVCWITHQTIKTYRSTEVQIHWFSAPNGGLWLILRPEYFIGTEKSCGVCGHGNVPATELIPTPWSQKTLALPGIKPRLPSRPNHSLVNILTELSRLRSMVQHRIKNSGKKVHRQIQILNSSFVFRPTRTPPPKRATMIK